MVLKRLLTLFLFFVSVGCSQNVDKVNIKPLRPPPSNINFVSDVEHQGGLAQPSVSTSAILRDQNLGGNLTRTKSSSPSFQMTSGIGVE